MKHNLLKVLYCPKCHGQFKVRDATEKNGEVVDGTLWCVKCVTPFPIIGYIPRLVDKANYSSSWGKLWRETGGILRDSFTGVPFHYNVIHGKYDQEGGIWKDGYSPFGFEWPTELKGETILEVRHIS
jgi:uncharacterized protein YbaR (Trm112 family)